MEGLWTHLELKDLAGDLQVTFELEFVQTYPIPCSFDGREVIAVRLGLARSSRQASYPHLVEL